MLHSVRLAAFAALAVALSACINSDYDLSAILKPEFPVKPGIYVKTDAPDTVIDVRRLDNAYRIYNRGTKATTFARLYKIPEYSDYLLQYYDRKHIVYLFLKPTATGFEILDIERLASVAPEHVTKLLKPISDDAKRDNYVTVDNGRRDTLYVVRELVRAAPKMTVLERYERKS
ncbi:MAG TPA: hypothetical protein VNK48_17525 [Xanthobacteraceae bacterium]|nr:hypothetical protein [Xanthobacteraceae bacterium]